MLCINCTDEHGFKRKCCGTSEFTQAEKDALVASGVDENKFKLTNDGWVSKMKVVGTYIEQNEDGQDLEYTVKRCIFLEDGVCSINDKKAFFSCKNYPWTSQQNFDCGAGGYEGTGY